MPRIIKYSQNHRRFAPIAIVALITLSGLWIVTTLRAQQQDLGGFRVMLPIRFDESTGTKKSTPTIPAEWKFVGVSTGEKANSNNLWFQDKEGNIYMVQGFVSHKQFILDDVIQKLASKQ